MFVIRLCEFEEEDAGCEAIDIGETVSDDSSGEFMGYYLGSVRVKSLKGRCGKELLTWRSREEKRCFIVMFGGGVRSELSRASDMTHIISGGGGWWLRT